MAVLKSLMARGIDAVREVITPTPGAIPAPMPDRGAQLQNDEAKAASALRAAKDDLELAYVEREEGLPDRTKIAEEGTQAAEQAFNRAAMATAAYRRITSDKDIAAAKQARIAAWDKAEELANRRIELAKKLTAQLTNAGAALKELLAITDQTYNLMPVKAQGGPGSYRLGTGDTESRVGIEIIKANLPIPPGLGGSALLSFPSLESVCADAATCVRLAREADGQS
jgi:hypothetical protein